MFFLRFCLFCGLVLTILPQLDGLESRASGLDALAPQLAVGNLVLALIMLAFRYRQWAIAGLVAAAWNAWTVWPELTFRGPPLDAALAADAPALKVVSLNAWFENAEPKRVADYLAASGADIVGLVEMSGKSKAALAPLQALYPYSVDCIDRDRFCQEMLLSKLPLGNAFAGRIGGGLSYVARGDVVWQGRTVAVTVAHIALPFVRPDWEPLAAWTKDEPPALLLPGTPFLWQSQQAAILAQYLTQPDRGGRDADRIVLGDFNSVAWSPLQRAFRQATGLENRGAARGAMTPSWPAWSLFFARIPIDHVFTGGALTVRALRPGPQMGSDHLPVEAEIGLKAE